MLLENAQKKLNSVDCPECSKKGKLEVILRCDLGTKDCTLTARCSNCETHFEVKENSRADGLSLNQTDFKKAVQNKEGNCPSCGNARVALGMRCEVTSHSCFEQYAPCSHCFKEEVQKAS
jgi:hypothetical protein